MSVNPVFTFPQSTDSSADPTQARAADPQPIPETIPGSGPQAESGNSQGPVSHASEPQDEVKVQIEPPGDIAVYRFLDQNGTLVLQVPPQQWLNLAQDISKELAQEDAPKAAAIEGAKDNGH